jgi:hypothetical protein
VDVSALTDQATSPLLGAGRRVGEVRPTGELRADG